MEALFATVLLLIAGSFTARVFVVSADANKRAQNIDMAVSVTTSAIDTFKASKAVDYNEQVFYDKNWDIIGNESESRFVLNFRVSAKTEDLYYISVTVADIASKNEKKRVLTEFNAVYYLREVRNEN